MPSVELSEAQFERLVGMLADNRVAIHTVKNEVVAAIAESEGRLKKEIQFLGAGLTALEEDMGRVQVGIRELLKTQGDHSQAVDGLTQLGKTNFDMNESILKQLHGESGASAQDHGETEESRGSGLT